MQRVQYWATLSCVALLGAIALAPQPLRAQTPAVKPAEEVYKNIVQLKGTPSDQLDPAMQFISASLGVSCDFCHVQGKFEADDKGAKKTAREMMAMTAMINKTSFGGRQQITCNSCHNGSTRPVSIPSVQDSDAPAHPAAMTPPAAGAQPTVDDILTRYITALGGADALQKVTSRVMSGQIVANGTMTPIEVFTKAPNMRLTITHNGKSGDSYTAFDGKVGWMGNTGRPGRAMSASSSAAFGLDAEFSLALRLKDLYPQLRRGRAETINGVLCDLVTGQAPGLPSVRLYFEKQSGLLLRLVRYADTPMGRLPTQIDYADYKDAGGAKMPWRWTLSRPNGRFTIQISETKANVPIDDAKFALPSGDVK
jgi:photosynthetic reaction center cytochrome c subunit